MEFSHLSFLGAFIMLVAGLITFATLRALLYRPLLNRYERSKLSGNIASNPTALWSLLRTISLLIFPALGFLTGDAVLSLWLG